MDNPHSTINEYRRIPWNDAVNRQSHFHEHTTPKPHPAIVRLVVTGALTLTSGTGCALLSNWCNALLVHAETTRDLADIRRDTRSEFAEQEQEARRQAAERDVANARLAAQREQFAREFCIANQEAQQEQLQRQIKDTVQSKVAFNVEQGLEVGELEVDTVALKELLDKREQEQNSRQPSIRTKSNHAPAAIERADVDRVFYAAIAPIAGTSDVNAKRTVAVKNK